MLGRYQALRRGTACVSWYLGIWCSLQTVEATRLRTVLPSMGMPGGTKGTEPVAMMMSLAVTVPPTSTRPASP